MNVMNYECLHIMASMLLPCAFVNAKAEGRRRKAAYLLPSAFCLPPSAYGAVTAL